MKFASFEMTISRQPGLYVHDHGNDQTIFRHARVDEEWLMGVDNRLYFYHNMQWCAGKNVNAYSPVWQNLLDKILCIKFTYV